MNLEHLFKLIRREDVALWIGAGFSLYAGYPSGQKLGELIYGELTSNEQAQLGQGTSLRSAAEALVTFRNQSRNELNRLLIQEFNKQPLSTVYHDLLSHIPHFKEIFTTNYDATIENAYMRRAHVVRNDRDIAYIQLGKPAIYKVHGDLIALDRIIVTENDYTSFISCLNRETPFWTAIKDVLSRKSLLFLGYGFEDENVWSWLDIIDQAIGNDRKERYLIAPGWNDLKIKKLQARHVTYIDMTADTFLMELSQHLKLHITSDLENGLVTQDTFNQYITLQEYNSKIKNEDGKPKLESLYKTDQLILNKINFAVKNKNAMDDIKRFEKGIGKSLKILSNQLSQFEHYVDEFKMNMSPETIKAFYLVRLTKHQNVRLEFPDEDLIIEGLTVDFYQDRENEFIAEGDLYSFKIKVKISYEKNRFVIKIDTSTPDVLPTISQCLIFQRALLYYSSGYKTLLEFDGKLKDVTASGADTPDGSIKQALYFYENLRKIERFFSVRFAGKHADYRAETFKAARELAYLIDHKYLQLDIPEGIDVQSDLPNVNDGVLQLPEGVPFLLAKIPGKEIIELLGIQLDLGEGSIQIDDPIRTTGADDNRKISVKSKTGIYFQRYTAFSKFEEVIIRKAVSP